MKESKKIAGRALLTETVVAINEKFKCRYMLKKPLINGSFKSFRRKQNVKLLGGI